MTWCCRVEGATVSAMTAPQFLSRYLATADVTEPSYLVIRIKDTQEKERP